MRSLRLSFIATKVMGGLTLALLVAPALFVTPAQAGAQSHAAAIGTVVQLDGPLFAHSADGRTRVIARGATVDAGDTLVTGNRTYAQVHFADNSDAILEPDTELTIDVFRHDATRSANDEARWQLVQGGMRVTSGDIARRGLDRHSIDTPFGSIAVTQSRFTVKVTPAAEAPVALNGRIYLAANSAGTMSDAPQPMILATTFITHYVPPPSSAPDTAASKTPLPVVPPTQTGGTTPPPVDTQSQLNALINGGGTTPPTSPSGTGLPTGPAGSGQVGPPVLSPGLHLQVTDGAIVVTNNGGSQGFQAGQFGFVPSVNQPPVIIPPNTGIQFVPPPSFNSGSGGPTASTGSGQGQETDCVVR